MKCAIVSLILWRFVRLNLALIYWIEASSAQASSANPPDYAGPSPEPLDIIRARGFTGELYRIKSSDGAPLSVYHIINPLADPRTLNRHPALVFHGLGMDASLMVSRSLNVRPRKPKVGGISYGFEDDVSMSFLLSNNNFDVWLADARGTNLNNHNATDDLNLFSSQVFWNFSLDEQALNDLPAIIDFVLAQTQSTKLVYVSYSESTLFMFALLSAYPHYANKIATFVAMAPVAYVAHARGILAPIMSPLMLLPDNLNANYMPQPVTDSVGVVVRRFCSLGTIFSSLCGGIAQGVAGSGDGTMVNAEEFYTTLAKSTSIKALKHFTQLIYQKRFGKFDYGPQMNLIKYGSARPPDYDLGKIRLPTIVLARGGRDFLSTTEDQERLLRELGVRPYLDLKLPAYNHLDFILDKNIGEELNQPLLITIFNILVSQNGLKGLLRDPEKPLPVRILEPVRVVDPNYILGSQLHLVGNLLDGIGIGHRQLESNNKLLGLPLKLLNTIGHGVDGLTGGIDWLPETILSQNINHPKSLRPEYLTL